MTAVLNPCSRKCAGTLAIRHTGLFRSTAGLFVFGLVQTIMIASVSGAQAASERLLRREEMLGTVRRKEARRDKSERFAGARASAEVLTGANTELASWLESSALRLVEPSQRRLNVTFTRGEQTNITNAVVTHICNDRWLPGALALAASLKNVGTKADRVLMLSGEVNSTIIPLLASYFDRVYVEEPIREHPSIKRAGADCLTLQLRAWQLPYKKALYMDADMVLLRNPDWLFDSYGEMSARMDHWGFGWNGGMFMCEPSQNTFTKLRNALKTYNAKARLQGMQQFLNFMYPRCNLSKPLDTRIAGCMKKPFPGSHNLFSRDLKPGEAAALIEGDFSRVDIGSLHFSGDWDTQKKPWMKGCMVGADSTTRYSGDVRMNILNLWMNSYRLVKPENNSEAAKSLLKIDCPVFDCDTRRKTMDYVMYLDNVDCWSNVMFRRLLQHAAPRRVIAIADKSVCETISRQNWHKLGTKVLCEDQSTLLPEVSFDAIHSWVLKNFHSYALTDEHGKIADSAKLLFKQFLKMGVAEAAEKLKLSENYVMWDSDMVLIRDFCPFNQEGQANFMEGLLGPENACQQGYRVAFEEMLGEKYMFSTGARKAFNPHHMVVNATVMKSFLQSVKSRYDGAHWSTTMMKAACRTLDNCTCGFSEYGAYASWMRKSEPAVFAELTNQYRVQCKTKNCPQSLDNPFNADQDLAVGRFALRLEGACPINDKKTQTPTRQAIPTKPAAIPTRPAGQALGQQMKQVHGKVAIREFMNAGIKNQVSAHLRDITKVAISETKNRH
mmetsp:Transcript_11226/g.21155  ORF Transcript_11226/g.21155 Transcript_11226/m.21155 type:complete len:782 (-) Transcript_11226:80-2425(-)